METSIKPYDAQIDAFSSKSLRLEKLKQEMLMLSTEIREERSRPSSSHRDFQDHRPISSRGIFSREGTPRKTARPSKVNSIDHLPVPPTSDKVAWERPATGRERPNTSGSPYSACVLPSNHNTMSRPRTSGGSRTVTASISHLRIINELREFVGECKKKLEDLFKEADPSGSSTIRRDKLLSCLCNAGFEIKRMDLCVVLELLGQDPDSPIKYSSFLSRLSTLTSDVPLVFEHLMSVTFNPTHLHRVVEERLRQRYKRALTAFHNEDPNNTGLLSMGVFLTALQGSTRLSLSKTQLGELLDRMDTQGWAMVDYNHFLSTFIPEHKGGNRVTSDWPEHSDGPESRGLSIAVTMSVDELLAALQERLQAARQHSGDRTAMFMAMDRDNDGTLTQQELLRTFNTFSLYPTPRQIEQLFSRLDVDRRGRIDFNNFLERVAPGPSDTRFPPSPGTRLTRNTAGAGRGGIVRNGSLDERVLQGQDTERPATSDTASSFQKFHTLVLSKMAQNVHKAQLLLQAQDSGHTGRVCKEQVLEVMRRLGLYLNVAQLNRLLMALSLPRSDPMIYSDFLDRIVESCMSNPPCTISRCFLSPCYGGNR